MLMTFPTHRREGFFVRSCKYDMKNFWLNRDDFVMAPVEYVGPGAIKYDWLMRVQLKKLLLFWKYNFLKGIVERDDYLFVELEIGRLQDPF